MVKRIHTGNKVKVINRKSLHYDETGVVIGVASQPVGMRLRNHLRVRLDNTGTVEVFLPEHLEVIG